MAEYKRIKKAKTVLALCFAESKETYHHWRVLSNGSDGVCIEFDKNKLLSIFEEDTQIRKGYVKYKLIKEIRGLPSIGLEDLPFLKRYPYRDEREYRVVTVGIPRKSLSTRTTGSRSGGLSGLRSVHGCR